MIVGYRDSLDFDSRPQFGYGSEDRRALRAIGHAVGRVLYVAAGEDSAVRQQDRRTDPEFGIRSMCILHHSHCGLLQLLPQRSGRARYAHNQRIPSTVLKWLPATVESCAIVNPGMDF